MWATEENTGNGSPIRKITRGRWNSPKPKKPLLSPPFQNDTPTPNDTGPRWAMLT